MQTLVSLSNDLASAVERAARAVVTVHARPRLPSTGIVWRSGFIVTAACDPRAQHGAYDPDGTYGVLPGEHYKNIEPEMLLDWLRRYFTMIDVTVDGRRGDVYACARP